jgi:V/A-type H+-transporting ATPase subunit I
VFFSFALFFAMILSDAGYAALLGLVLLYFWKRMGNSPAGQRFRTMATALVIASLVWGVLTGGYFGVSPPPDSLLGSFKVFDINDFDTMMRLSVFIGVVHLAVANVAMARQAWGKKTAYVPLGWVSAMFGGYAMWLGYSDVDPKPLLWTIGTLLLMGGLGVVFVFSSDRPIHKPLDWLWRVLDGLKGLSGITGIFGDVLSYMRLFALGLASASLALTFNQLAGQVAAAVPGIGFFFSLLILLVGHGLNVLLSLMSGVVHGLRLNFIEFFKWGMSEEGYPFRAFAKQETQA